MPAPLLGNPSNGSIDVSRSPTLSWNAASGAVSYQIQVSTSDAFSPLTDNTSGITGTSRALSGLGASTKYYWRVRGTNAGGDGACSQTWNLTTVPPPPPAPLLGSPANGATNISRSPTLTWNPASGATTYQIHVSTSDTFSPLTDNTSGITGTSRSLTGLASGTKYYWRVRGTNAGGNGAWSSTWSFTTVPPPPAAPVLELPADNATYVDLNPTLQWAPPAGAEWQEVELSTSSDFSSLVENAIVGSDFVYHVVSTPLGHRTTYY